MAQEGSPPHPSWEGGHPGRHAGWKPALLKEERAGLHSLGICSGVCGDSDNGFSLPFNWNLLGDGIHTVRAFADDVLFAETKVKVTTLGREMVWDAERSGEGLPIFFLDEEGTGSFKSKLSVEVAWWETLQSFVITEFKGETVY